MDWRLHLDIGVAALEAGLLDVRAMASAMVEVGLRDCTASPAEIWLKPGRLAQPQLDGLLTEISRRPPRSGRSPSPIAVAQTLVREPTQAMGDPASAHTLAFEPAAKPLPSPAATAVPGEPAASSERYRIVAALGAGGMGDVFECFDAQLGRRVAIKTLRPELLGDASSTRMLEREARVTGSLEHPGIIPVYDVGVRIAQGPFYVMRLVEQATLEDVLSRLALGQPSALAEFTLGRLLRSFVQVCQAIDYAHSRGVIHCDLKPANILLGQFGEVLVVDWGLAYSVHDRTAYRGGTPGYMAPEQMDPTRVAIDARTDVFALGAILYEILCFEPAFAHALVTAPAGGQGRLAPLVRPPPPSERRPGRTVPPELEELCMRALELDPAARIQDVHSLATGIEAFLEGTKERERRAARAGELVEAGDRLAESYAEFLESRPERLAELASLRETIAPWEPAERKRLLWDAEERLAVTDALGVRTLQAAVAAYEQALDEVPQHAEARRGLAKLYLAERERASGRRDELDKLYFEGLLKQYDDGTIAGGHETHGSVRLVGEPGAQVTIAPVAERDRRLVDIREPQLLTLPCEPCSLPTGRYSLRATSGTSSLVAPLVVRPGEETRFELRLSEGADLEPWEALIPAGPCLLGRADGDDTQELELVELAAFVIGRQPVLFEEYLAFLAERYAAEGSQADPLLPLLQDGAALWRWDGDKMVAAGISQWGSDPAALAQLPAFGVDASSAEAYCRWRSSKHGKHYRLPTETEWEKAARGIDGRRYPWGDSFDASFCKMRESRPGLAYPEPPGRFGADVSPYGVLDMAGGVADWVVPVGGGRSAEGGVRELASRGGAWCDWRADCLPAARRRYLSIERSVRIGFRLARSVGAST